MSESASNENTLLNSSHDVDPKCVTFRPILLVSNLQGIIKSPTTNIQYIIKPDGAELKESLRLIDGCLQVVDDSSPKYNFSNILESIIPVNTEDSNVSPKSDQLLSASHIFQITSPTEFLNCSDIYPSLKKDVSFLEVRNESIDDHDGSLESFYISPLLQESTITDIKINERINLDITPTKNTSFAETPEMVEFFQENLNDNTQESTSLLLHSQDYDFAKDSVGEDVCKASVGNIAISNKTLKKENAINIVSLMPMDSILLNNVALIPQEQHKLKVQVVPEQKEDTEAKPSDPIVKFSVKEEAKPFQCPTCHLTFNLLGNLTRHKKIHSTSLKEEEKFQCEMCNKSFLQRCDLARHRHIHTGTEPHRCSQCGKGYLRHSDLITHQRFHNKEKPFVCNHCQKGFSQKGDLNRHIRSLHAQVKPLVCSHCPKKFVKKATLVKHQQTAHRSIVASA